ncbi:MAG: hypothetical protein M1829_002007 [Trizodia sp. TS-e1964]|nr:MAG: hypothetical protein M1829_002007 [Trizodia sp. TS-e1964]
MAVTLPGLPLKRAVTVVETSAGNTICNIPTDNVYELCFSPRGSYLTTWQRPSKDQEGNATKNLKVWRLTSAPKAAGVQENGSEVRVVGRFVQKSQTGWSLQYTPDEEYCARTVTNEVQFYRSGDLGTVWNKLHIEGVTDFALSPGKQNSIAVFIPERKGQPASVKIYHVPHFETVVSQKTFFKCDKIQLKWNNHGTELIVLTQTEVDKTNKNYFGETNLFLLSINGGLNSRIHLDKEGPIQDVTWSPNSKEFGVVYGYMPMETIIFNARGVATHTFQLAPRNTIRFSPTGRFVIVAGFGNLAGQMDIYDLEKDFQKVCTIEGSNASVCQWSPDGMYILTATVSPRLRVDNGVRIWHVSGALMYNEDMKELYQICWRPQPNCGTPKGDPVHAKPTPHASALAYLGTVKTPSKPAGAYRPPGARGQVTPLHFKREDEGGAVHINNGATFGGTNGFAKTRRREVPGAEPLGEDLLPGGAPGGGVSLLGIVDMDEGLSKAAIKNKKKREAKKAKEAADKESGLLNINPNTGDINHKSNDNKRQQPQIQDRLARGQERSISKGNLPPRAPSQRRDGSGGGNASQTFNNASPGTQRTRAPVTTQTFIEPPPDLTVTSPTTGSSPHDKKLRGLLKKIRAIEDLRMRLAGGEKLEDTQMKKIATEDAVRKELRDLGFDA